MATSVSRRMDSGKALWSLFTEPAFKKHGAGITPEKENSTAAEKDK